MRAAFVAALLAIGAAHASETGTPVAAGPAEGAGDPALAALLALEGDAAYGAYLAGECTGCHASLDQATELPSLEALPDAYIREQLHLYRTGAREHQVMNMLAARLGDEEIAALGAHLGASGED